VSDRNTICCRRLKFQTYRKMLLYNCVERRRSCLPGLGRCFWSAITKRRSCGLSWRSDRSLSRARSVHSQHWLTAAAGCGRKCAWLDETGLVSCPLAGFWLWGRDFPCQCVLEMLPVFVPFRELRLIGEFSWTFLLGISWAPKCLVKNTGTRAYDSCVWRTSKGCSKKHYRNYSQCQVRRTALRAWRSRVRFQVGSLDFLIDVILPGRTMTRGATEPLTEMSASGISWGIKATGA
jgi:hypothetical protein